MKAPSTLRGRALALLAQREQSRVELRRKLLRVARRAEQAAAAEGADVAADVDALLDSLQAAGLLCEARFVESRVHARASRFGDRRIAAELKQHGLALPADAARALRDSEHARAAVVRERRFGAPPSDAAERARQARFLAARGFSAEVVHRLLRTPR